MFALSEDIVIDSESDGSAADLGVQTLSRSPQTAAAEIVHVQSRNDTLLHDSDSDSGETSTGSSMHKGAEFGIILSSG